MIRHRGRVGLCCAILAIGVTACNERRAPSAPTPSTGDSAAIASDAALYALVTQGQPFSAYTRFPNVGLIRSGTSAHQPVVRVRLNAAAYAVLQDGRLPAGSRFPSGSVIFKEVLSTTGAVDLYTIMYKDPENPLSANGWLWAEYRPDAAVMYSVSNRGGACTSCHSLAQGPRNDFVRTFERQD